MAVLVKKTMLHNIWLADEEGIFIFHDEVNETFSFSPDKDGTNLINDIPASVILEVAEIVNDNLH